MGEETEAGTEPAAPGAEVNIMIDEQPRDTTAWRLWVWISFVVAVGTMAVGIVYAPVAPWTRAFLGMGLLFSVGSTFSLAKTVRDDHESKRLRNRIRDAKTEQVLREYEPSLTS